MTAGMFLSGVLLFGILAAQLYKVYEADKEYKKALEEYLRIIKKK